MKEQTTNLLDEECAIKLRAMETKYDMTLCLVKEVLFKRRRLIWLSREIIIIVYYLGRSIQHITPLDILNEKPECEYYLVIDSLTDRKTKRQNIFISYNFIKT